MMNNDLGDLCNFEQALDVQYIIEALYNSNDNNSMLNEVNEFNE